MTIYRQLSNAIYAWINWNPWEASRFDGPANNSYPECGLYYLKGLDVNYKDVLKINIKSKYEKDVI